MNHSGRMRELRRELAEANESGNAAEADRIGRVIVATVRARIESFDR